MSGTDMPEPVLDHVVLDVHDAIDAASARYRELGFTLTPRGHHTLGSLNHLAMFQTDYLELLGWPEGDGAARPELQRFPRGMNGLVFKTDSAAATFARLHAAGLAGTPPRSFSRPVALAGGVQEARFRTVSVDAGLARVGRVYFCEHLTPDLVWRPEWQAHANGAAAIHSLVIASPDPGGMAALLRAMFGERAVRSGGARSVMQAGRAFIEIVPATAGSDRIVALRIDGAGPARNVPAEQACGVELEFIRA